MTEIDLAEGKELKLNCSMVKEDLIIWKVNGMSLTELSDRNKSFQSAPNSTLIIRNSMLGKLSGAFNVSCLINGSTNTNNGKIYRVHFQKGTNCNEYFINLLLTREPLCN